MGNCAGCTGPQRTYRVQKLQQNSPIKNRLSNANKYYTPSNYNLKQSSFLQKDKIVERGSFNQNDLFGGNIGLSQSKNRQSRSNLKANQSMNINEFQNNIFSQVLKTHIKLYPDNPENLREIKNSRPQIYQKQEDLRNSKMEGSRRQSQINTFSNQLLRSVQSQSKKYLREYNHQQSPTKISYTGWNGNQIKNSSGPLPNVGIQSPRAQSHMPRFDDISQIRTQNMGRNYYEHEHSLPLKKYSRYNRDLTIIEQILQEDHRTPLDIKLQRKKNGQDIIYDTFQGFSDQLEPLQIPNMNEYLSTLKLVVQKN